MKKFKILYSFKKTSLKKYQKYRNCSKSLPLFLYFPKSTMNSTINLMSKLQTLNCIIFLFSRYNGLNTHNMYLFNQQLNCLGVSFEDSIQQWSDSMFVWSLKKKKYNMSYINLVKASYSSSKKKCKQGSINRTKRVPPIKKRVKSFL